MAEQYPSEKRVKILFFIFLFLFLFLLFFQGREYFKNFLDIKKVEPQKISLEELKIDLSILDNPFFRSLEPYTPVNSPSTGIGRENPFEPLKKPK